MLQQADHRSDSATARIRATIPSLIPSQARVASVILDNPADVLHFSVTELGQAAGASASTVVRFAQKMGYRGFQHLKTAIAQDTAVMRRPDLEEIGEDASADNVLNHVALSSEEAIRDALTTISRNAFTAAAQALDAAVRVLCVGIGTSAPLAQDAAYRLSTVGLQATFTPDAHLQHIWASLLGPGDVCLAISHTGSTHETLAAVRAAHAAGATTIAVTSHFQSPLTEVAALNLVAGSRETRYRVEAMASRIAHLVTLDALYVALAAANSERARRAQEQTLRVVSEHRI